MANYLNIALKATYDYTLWVLYLNMDSFKRGNVSICFIFSFFDICRRIGIFGTQILELFTPMGAILLILEGGGAK